ncbi:MAG TPA: hypothetical protein PKE29_15715 [Phycisphaerales bacterium]|nr:hypothetical protein [Phycisphaerales bacterium]
MGSAKTTAKGVLAAVCLLAGSAAAGAAPAGVTYFLRAGSTAQEGCHGLCACLLLFPEPLRGTFVLTPGLPDPVFQNYTIDDVRLRAPALGQVFVGSGTYQTVSAPPGQQQIFLNMSINGEPPLDWFGGRRTFAMPTPVVEASASLPGNCFDIALIIKATPFRADWNADGAISTDDVFDFLTGWLAGDGDANEDGRIAVDDIFEFVNAWLARR